MLSLKKHSVFLDLVPNSLVGPRFLKKAPLKIMKWASHNLKSLTFSLIPRIRKFFRKFWCFLRRSGLPKKVWTQDYLEHSKTSAKINACRILNYPKIFTLCWYILLCTMVNCTFCKEYMSTLISVISFYEVFNQSFNWLYEFETK